MIDNNNVFKAVEILNNASMKKFKADRTLKVKITQILDLNKGTYQIKYQDGFLTVYSKDPKIFYKVGDEVYIKIPEGDLSNTKYIENLTSYNDTLLDSELTQLKNKLFPVSGNFLPDGKLALIAGIKEIEENSTTNRTGNSEKEFSLKGTQQDNFNWYAKNYEILQIKAKFQTKFYNEHSKGNYGLRIVFETNSQEAKTFTYNFDLKDFNGNPYSFKDYTEQSVNLEVKKGYLTKIQSITFFQNDFKQDEYQNGQDEKVLIKQFNLFVKDISISFLERKDLSNIPYYLSINAPYGHIFNDSNKPKFYLEGKLIGEGKELDIEQSHWFERDSSIGANSEGYNKDAGIGWKEIFNGDKFIPTFSDIQYERQYKLVAIYKGMTFIAETSIQNQANIYNLSINQKTVGQNVKLEIKGTDNLVGDWYILLNDGSSNNYQLIGQKVNNINVTPYLNYSTKVFQCDIYKENGRQPFYLTTKKYTLQVENPQNNDKYFALFDGPTLFRYDANGDIGTEEYSKKYSLTLTLELLSEERFFDRNKVDLTWKINDTKLIPGETISKFENSLIENCTYTKGTSVDIKDNIQYNINRKFNENKNKTVIIVEVKDKETGSIDKFEKEIIFLKTGDQGTNGTEYSVIISSNQKAIYGSNSGNIEDSHSLNLTAIVKKGQEDFSGEVKYEWSLPEDKNHKNNYLTLQNKNNNVVSVTCAKEPDNGLNLYYVKLKTTITEDGKTSILYNLYPIDIIVGNHINLPELDLQIPSLIQYNSAGERPRYNTSALIFKIGKIDYSTQIEKFSQNNILVDIKDIKESPDSESIIGKKLDPVGKFLADTLEIGLIRCFINAEKTNYILHPVILYLNTFGNETINGWDGTKYEIDDKGTYILAPQIGAGKKDPSTNTFTGIIMGKDSVQNKIGLYGYENGVATFGLKDNGSVFIGSSSQGQILINNDGQNKAVIKSATWNTTEDGTGMYLNLTDGILKMKGTKILEGDRTGFIDLNANATKYPLRIGVKDDPNFKVEWNGKLYATGADIEGAIHMGAGSTITWGDGTTGPLDPARDKIGQAELKNAIDGVTQYDDIKVSEYLKKLGINEDSTLVGACYIYSPQIISGKLFAGKAESSSYVNITDQGFSLSLYEGESLRENKIVISSEESDGIYLPYIKLGTGSNESGDFKAPSVYITKESDGLWIGDKTRNIGLKIPVYPGGEIGLRGIKLSSTVPIIGTVKAIWG